MRVMVLTAVLLLPVIGPMAQERSLVATVDRDEIHANESFVYRLTAFGDFPGQPDFSVITRDFDVLGESRVNSVQQAFGGRRVRVLEWRFELMPRSAGEFLVRIAARLVDRMSPVVEGSSS